MILREGVEMKFIRNILIILVILGAIGFFAYSKVHVEVNEEDLPEDVYEQDGNLLLLLSANMLDLFVLDSGDEYTLIEESVNLIILDAIRENVNDQYDPLGTCETDECNFITATEDYYVNYLWAELSDDNQLIIHVSVGSDKYIHINTIIDLYFDIEINYTDFGFTLTLTNVFLADMEISMDRLDQLLEYADKDAIEASVTTGELDIDEYTYTITFPDLIPLPF